MRHFFLLIGYWLLLQGCHSSYQPRTLQYDLYRVTDSAGRSTKLAVLLDPYREEVVKKMNDVVGFASMTLEKKQPESAMGNFFADALLAMAIDKYQVPVDAAFLNFGGLRLNQVPAGPVTRGKIFELMPFDNLVVLQKMKGEILQKFLDHTAAAGGWPVAGLKMQIRDKKAVNVIINGKPLDPAAEYVIANADFVANGGDNAEMLRSIPQISSGYLVRDAFIEYIAKLKTAGRDISSQIENRVSYAQ